MKLFVEVYRLRRSVFTHWDTLALWWCANTETKKKRNRVIEIENRIEPNLKNPNRLSPTTQPRHVMQTSYRFRSNVCHQSGWSPKHLTSLHGIGRIGARYQ